MDAVLGRRIEDASLRAWPALESEVLDGWELRSAGGFTKRANSVQPFSSSTRSISEKVEECEAWYEARGMPAIFRLTPFADPELDSLLDQWAYEIIEPTDVLFLRLPASMTRVPDVELIELELQDWLQSYGALRGVSRRSLPSMRAILEACRQDRFRGALCSIRSSEQVGCGLAVADQELVGLFDLVTAQRHRRRGYGAALVAGLLDWGLAQGASYAYLQVARSNTPAWGLYRHLGFAPAYEYWYRVRARLDAGFQGAP